MVAQADACGDPEAVVIEAQHTAAAVVAVLGAHWLLHSAVRAPPPRTAGIEKVGGGSGGRNLSSYVPPTLLCSLRPSLYVIARCIRPITTPAAPPVPAPPATHVPAPPAAGQAGGEQGPGALLAPACPAAGGAGTWGAGGAGTGGAAGVVMGRMHPSDTLSCHGSAYLKFLPPLPPTFSIPAVRGGGARTAECSNQCAPSTATTAAAVCCASITTASGSPHASACATMRASGNHARFW
ncbi:unnamed protein product [Closterium sp. NIES-65]|nr:unnamed protein product [Closterium sp. NIES-65]